MPKRTPPLKLSVRRQPSSDHSYKAERRFNASLSVDHNGPPYDHQWLSFRFAMERTGLRVSLFDAAIYPRDFAQVAQMMMDADPVAAIHAFGAAMQAAAIDREQTPEDDELAA